MHAVNGIPFQTIYDQAHLQALGATFDEFISDPRGTLERVGQSDAPEIIERGHRPLLPAQVRLRRQWIQGWQTNGTWDDRQQQIPQQRGTPVRLLPAAVTHGQLGIMVSAGRCTPRPRLPISLGADTL